jgi:hypothetical protein
LGFLPAKIGASFVKSLFPLIAILPKYCGELPTGASMDTGRPSTFVLKTVRGELLQVGGVEVRRKVWIRPGVPGASVRKGDAVATREEMRGDGPGEAVTLFDMLHDRSLLNFGYEEC